MKHIIPILVILLFIVTAVSPMVIGFKSDAVKDVNSEMETLLDNLAFYCYDASDSNAKYEYYKEQMLKEHPENDIDIVEDVVQSVEPISTASSGGPMDSAWPMFCHDVRRTGRSPYGATGGAGVGKWKFWMDGLLKSSPAIDENRTIYIGSTTPDSLIAIYPNGTEKWRFKAKDWIQSSPAIVEDGTIYVGSDDGSVYFGGTDGYHGYLYALNPDGTEKWKIDMIERIPQTRR